jgi:hypothetical protein
MDHWYHSRVGDSVAVPPACREPAVTIARRRPARPDAIALAMPGAPPATPAGRPIGVSLLAHDVPAPESVSPAGRLRRCTFRRIDRVAALPGRAVAVSYEVMCLYEGAGEPASLGDVDSARPICEACTATGIFRPDEA